MTWGILAILALSLSGCAIRDGIHERQQATVMCRDLGFLGAVKDSAVWYCFREKLVMPVTR